MTVERQTAATGVDARRPDRRHRPRHAAGLGHDDVSAGGRALRLHRAHARLRAAPDPVLVPHGSARRSGTPPGRRCAAPASTRRRRRAAPAASRATAIRSARPGSASPPSCPGPSASSASRSRGRRSTSASSSRAGRTSVRVEPRIVHRRRRAPPDRLRRAAVQPQPVPAHVRRSRARRRNDPARGRAPTTSSSTAPRPRAPARSRSATGSTTRHRRPPRSGRSRVKRGAQLVVAELRPRVRRRSGLARRARRRRGAARPVRSRTGAHLDRGPAQGQARAPAPDLRLPGDAEHGERRPDPAEHAHPHDDASSSR